MNQLTRKLLAGVAAVGLVLGTAGIAAASEADTSVVDTTSPTGAVTLAPGGTADISIRYSVTGNQVGTATFVHRTNWVLTSDVFAGSDPTDPITIGPRAGGDPATTGSNPGTISVDCDQEPGTFTLAVAAEDVTNSNTTGAKLSVGDASTYLVTVQGDPDPSCAPAVAPVVSYVLNPAAPNGDGGWYKTGPISLTWTVTGTPTPTLTGCVDQTITDDQAKTTYSCEATNSAGADSDSVEIGLDSTAPTVSLNGGPADGSSHYFGFVPAAPTCSAVDPTPGSGLAGSCTVTGYGTTVGSHTVIGSQSDVAGNAGSSSASYTVLAWTPGGFYSPVDMDKLNIVKGGSTVPLKFEVFAGSTELTSTTVVDTFRALKTDCSSGASLGTDEIEQYTSGATALRYDSTGGQFIQNWQTPKTAGICYHVVLTLDDGSTIEADFKTK